MSARSPERVAWMNMIARCDGSDPRYGGRGIRVCERWRNSFAAFLTDVGTRPTADHSLDRANYDGHYEPGNVRWATDVEQARNRSDNRLITVAGRIMPLSAWAEETGTKRETIAMRLDHGYPPERAVDPTPVFPRYSFRDELLTVHQIAKRVGIPQNSLQRRLVRHGDIEMAISEWKRNGRGKKSAAPPAAPSSPAEPTHMPPSEVA